jgi:mono/diheme cytochrome c family protein
MKRLLLIVLPVIVVMGGSTVAYLLFTGPRMFVQPNIRPFQAILPAMPANTVPVTDVIEPLPVENATLPGDASFKLKLQSLANPVASTQENRARGKIYYGYYCGFCHGENGDGTGPVGFSYHPVPADLRSPKVRAMTDGEILVSMLTGTGHAPVLQKIVPSEYRWYLALYVRGIPEESPTKR